MGKIKFFDQKIQTNIERDGLAIVDFLNVSEVSNIFVKLENLSAEVSTELFFGNLQSESIISNYREFLITALEEKINQLGTNISIIEPTFIITPPGNGSINFHQDWSMVNEEKARSYSIWFPLQDVDEKNGTFAVIRESHNFFDNYRSSIIPWEYLDESFLDLFEKHKFSLPLKKGQAIIFDSKLIHYTYPNESSFNRFAILVGFKPKDEKLLHYYQTNDFNKLEVYEISSNFFNNYDYLSRPKGYACIGTVDKILPITIEEMECKIVTYEWL